MTLEKLLLRHAFGRAASSYDSVADYQREAGIRLMDLTADLDLAPETVLDAGCGTGHGLQLIAQRWPDANTIALDFAAPMLTRIMQGNKVCADIERLPLAAGSIDLLWSSLAMQWCDAAQVVQESQRVLHTGGHMVASTLGPATFAELRRAFVGVDSFRHTNDFIEVDRLRQTVLQAGLTPIKMQRTEMVRHYPDLRALLASVRDLGANHVAASNRRPGLMGKHAWRRFVDNYERMRTPQGLPLTYDTYFMLARK